MSRDCVTSQDLKPVTVSRRDTIDVLPFGKDWQASDVKTTDSKVIAGK